MIETLQDSRKINVQTSSLKTCVFFAIINFSHMTLFEPPISLKTLSVFDLQT